MRYLSEVTKTLVQCDFDSIITKEQYIGPDEHPLGDDFKVAYVNLFLNEDYRIIYVGNGSSDVSPSRKCHHVFATGALLAHCKEMNLSCTPFATLNEVVVVLESW